MSAATTGSDVTDLTRRLRHRVAEAQRDWRSPAVSAGVVRDGALVWSHHVGSARVAQADVAATAPTDDTAYLIGSVTKTFTALLVLMLRDEGLVALDAPVGRYLGDVAHDGLRLRELLSHHSGLQREPLGEIWQSLVGPDAQQLLEDLSGTEAVLPPSFQFHYSNLAYALLGQVIERVTGQSYESVLHTRLLGPLGMTRTGLTPPEGHAYGYAVHPFARTVAREGTVDLGALGPLGGLWSTVADLGRYAAFVASPDPAIIAPATVEQMCRPVVMTDLESWRAAYGLGFGMQRHGERVLVGHGGGMPGFLTGLQIHRGSGVAAVVFANTSTVAACVELAGELVVDTLTAEPEPPSAWAPEEPRAELTEILGRWWTEGSPLEFFVDNGQLCAVLPQDGIATLTRFAAEGLDRYRAVDGRERGELLLVRRTPSGSVDHLTFATYAVTREFTVSGSP